MGYLTTITIRNDGLGEIEKHQDEFMEKLISHCNMGRFDGEDYFSVGCHANPVVLQYPRHADNHTVYVHMGNTVVEMNPYSDCTNEMAENHPDFFEGVLKYMERQIRELKKLRKGTV